MKATIRAAASLSLALFLGALGLACPAYDLTIRISDNGVANILAACRGFQKLCSSLNDCKEDPLSCEIQGGKCILRNRCQIGDQNHPGWTTGGKKAGRLILLSIEGTRLGDASPCFGFDPSICSGNRGCFADLLNQSLDQMIKNGLSFDGFNEQEDVLLSLAIFDAEGQAGADCDPDRLLACAGLAPPLGGGDYDITCASCQNGSHFSLGRDNGPCPISQQECFLQRCDRLLRASK